MGPWPNRIRAGRWRTNGPLWPGCAPPWRCWRAAIGLTSLARVADLPRAIDLLSAAICLLGAVVGGSALRTYRLRDAAMRPGEPLPHSRMLTVLVGSIVVRFALRPTAASPRRSPTF